MRSAWHSLIGNRLGRVFPERRRTSYTLATPTPSGSGVNVLVARNYQPSNLVRLLPAPVRTSVRPEELSRFGGLRSHADSWAGVLPEFTDAAEPRRNQAPGQASSEVNELLYL